MSLQNIGIIGSTVVLGMQLIYQGSSIGTNYWLNFWSNGTFGNSAEPEYRDLYLGVYGAFGFVQAVSVMILTISLSITTLDASKVLISAIYDVIEWENLGQLIGLHQQLVGGGTGPGYSHSNLDLQKIAGLNRFFFMWDKCCHLTLYFCLMEPNYPFKK